MKRLYLIYSLFLFNFPVAQAQLTYFLTARDNPDGIAINGNNLYFTEVGAGRLSQIDITQENPEAAVLLTGLENPLALIYNDGDLIFSAGNPNRIVRYNIATATSTTLIEDTGGEVGGLHLTGDWLYLSQDNRIVRADISQATPTLEVVATGFSSQSFAALRMIQDHRRETRYV